MVDNNNNKDKIVSKTQLQDVDTQTDTSPSNELTQFDNNTIANML